MHIMLNVYQCYMDTDSNFCDCFLYDYPLFKWNQDVGEITSLSNNGKTSTYHGSSILSSFLYGDKVESVMKIIEQMQLPSTLPKNIPNITLKIEKFISEKRMSYDLTFPKFFPLPNEISDGDLLAILFQLGTT